MIRCDVCGRFISYADLGSELALIDPPLSLDESGEECISYPYKALCKLHNDQNKDQSCSNAK